MGLFSLTQELAIDLGTANTLIIHNGRVVVDEPSIVAIDSHSGKLVAIGERARAMHEKTNPNIKTIRPLKDGVIADFTATELMLRGMIKKVKSSGHLTCKDRKKNGISLQQFLRILTTFAVSLQSVEFNSDFVMKTLKLDISKAGVEITPRMEERTREALSLLYSKQGAGNDFLGWVTLPSSIAPQELSRIGAEAKKLRECADVIICIGIGGSYLGAKAVAKTTTGSLRGRSAANESPIASATALAPR